MVLKETPMDVQHLTVPVAEAEKMLRKYREHKSWSTPVDHEIMKIYATVAKGKTVINARQSIIEAGLGADKLPHLGIARADGRTLILRHGWDEAMMITDESEWGRRAAAASRKMTFPVWEGMKKGRFSAMVPHIPPDIRPKRGIENYHVLFEAVWRPEPPIDPYLLRRMGKTDFFVVLAAWDLTEIERAVMAAHMPRQRQ
jgi:hypothetical protein